MQHFLSRVMQIGRYNQNHMIYLMDYLWKLMGINMGTVSKIIKFQIRLLVILRIM